MTDQQLADIRALHTAATPGKWVWSDTGLVWSGSGDPWTIELLVHTGFAEIEDKHLASDEQQMANSKFIAAAHTTIPLLLAALDHKDAIIADILKDHHLVPQDELTVVKLRTQIEHLKDEIAVVIGALQYSVKSTATEYYSPAHNAIAYLSKLLKEIP